MGEGDRPVSMGPLPGPRVLDYTDRFVRLDRAVTYLGVNLSSIVSTKEVLGASIQREGKEMA
jgi:hypothetical protein